MPAVLARCLVDAAHRAGLALGLARDTKRGCRTRLQALGGDGLMAIIAEAIGASGKPIQRPVHLRHIIEQYARHCIAACAVEQGARFICRVVAIARAGILFPLLGLIGQSGQPGLQLHLLRAQAVSQPRWNDNAAIDHVARTRGRLLSGRGRWAGWPNHGVYRTKLMRATRCLSRPMARRDGAPPQGRHPLCWRRQSNPILLAARL